MIDKLIAMFGPLIIFKQRQFKFKSGVKFGTYVITSQYGEFLECNYDR